MLKIKNLVSDNEYVYYIHTDYFQKYLKPWEYYYYIY
jgi:hypothetical protein